MSTNKRLGKVRANGVNFEMISDEDARKVDYATRDILSRYGIKVTDDEAIDIFAKAGCEVDKKTMMVKIPDWLITKALASAPSRFKLYGREEKNTRVQESMQKITCFTNFGCGYEVCEYLGNGKFKTRDSLDADLANVGKICDWAENIDVVSTSIQSRDWVEKGSDDVHQLFTLLKNTTKHVHHINPVGTNVDYYWEIVKAYYRGDEKLAREKPIFSIMVCATSPLEIGSNNAQGIIRGARYGIPLVMQTMALAGATGPAEIAGSLTVTNCEVVAQIVLAQIVRPGLPVWYASTTTILDMYDSVAPMGNPEISMICAAMNKLANMYGIPMWSAGMWSDSKVPDAQAAAEKALTGFVEAAAGCSMIYGCGNIELGSTFSPEQLVIDNSIISTIKHVLNGIKIDDDTISVDQIIDIGACGEYLAEPNSMEVMATYSKPPIFDRTLLEAWRKSGSLNILERAHEVVLDVMANHKVKPIDPDVLKEMEKIVKKADAVAVKKMEI